MDLQNLSPRFYLFNGTFAYFGKSIDTDFHSHHALQVCLSLTCPFIIETDKEQGKHIFFIIDSDVKHRFDGQDGWHLILLMDPEHALADAIKQQAGKVKSTTPDQTGLNFLIEDIVDLMLENYDCEMVIYSLDNLLAALSGTVVNTRKTDERIQKIFTYIAGLEEKKTSLVDLAQLVNLSESRLSHIFKDQVGIPVRRFLLWARLMATLKSIIHTRSLTEAAMNAGFADSAHFTRTFRRMFGVIPSVYIKNLKGSRFIQAKDCMG